jgi:hypothetical protein
MTAMTVTAAAYAHASEVTGAQPCIEFELVSRTSAAVPQETALDRRRVRHALDKAAAEG